MKIYIELNKEEEERFRYQEKLLYKGCGYDYVTGIHTIVSMAISRKELPDTIIYGKNGTIFHLEVK